MRILLDWGGGLPNLALLINGLQSRGHELVYWIGGAGQEKLKLPQTVFHHGYLAVAGRPARGIDAADFSPPGKELVERLYKTESIVLTMMNKKFDRLCTDERRHIYYNMLQYWQGILKKLKPEAIIFHTIPHTIYNYVIYELARLRGIKTIMFLETTIGDRLLLYNDFRRGSENFIKALQLHQGKTFILNDLSDDLSKYYRGQADKSRDISPAYMADARKPFFFFPKILLKIKIIIVSIKDLSILKKVIYYFYKFFKANCRKEYLRVQLNPDYNKNYIYVPLQLQPECTTSPMGDMFTDQILMIEILAAAIPDDWLIYVKEHPIQMQLRGLNYFSARYRGYYEKIAKLKRVRIVSTEINTYHLIKKSQAVATVTGTAGWEAVLRSKPALIFGYAWYRDCPGVFRVEGVESCRAALATINGGYKIDQQQIINYLKSFEQATFHGLIAEWYRKYSGLSEKANANNFIEAIENELNRAE